MPLSASTLFALSQGADNSGRFECHFCASPCSERYTHDEPPFEPYVRIVTTAKRPANPYQCRGCWLYNRNRTTVTTIQGRQIDGKAFRKYSWLITENKAQVLIDSFDRQALYPLLLQPPHKFALSLIEQDKDGNRTSLLQVAQANDLQTIQMDTPLYFTFNNTVSHYTIYELQEGLRHGADGKLPGVRMLIQHLGPHKLPDAREEENRQVGRPKKTDEGDARKIQKVVSKI